MGPMRLLQQRSTGLQNPSLNTCCKCKYTTLPKCSLIAAAATAAAAVFKQGWLLLLLLLRTTLRLCPPAVLRSCRCGPPAAH
jgi:hypothetical protein